MLVASLPVARPTELIRVGDTDNCCVTTGLQRSFSLFSYDLYRQLRDRTPEFSDLAAFQAQPVSVSVRSVPSTNPPEAFIGELVSGNYFQTFGLSPALGRLLLPSDDRPDSPPVVVLSHRAWLQRFAGDPRIVGTTFAINGIPSEVIGVAPAGFYGAMLRPDSEEIWIPLANEPRLQPQAHLVTVRGAHWLYAIGRLRQPDLELRQIEARLTSVLQQWLQESPDLPAEFAQQIPSQVIHLVSAASGVTSLRGAVAPSLRVLLAIEVRCC